jgi:hypothetical protein
LQRMSITQATHHPLLNQFAKSPNTKAFGASHDNY